MTNDDVAKIKVDGWPLPDEFLIEIGRVAANWTLLEATLDLYIAKLAGFNGLEDPKPFILVKHSSVAQKIDMLAALCEHLLPQHQNLENYTRVVKCIRSAQKLRNRLLHNGIVQERSGEFKIVVGAARGKLKTSAEAIDVGSIRRAALEIHRSILDLHELVTGKKYPPFWER